MANHYPTLILRMEMHRTAKAILKHLAISTLSSFHPGTVTEGLETVFPNVEEIVLIDVALDITSVDVGAGGNGAIYEDGADSNTRAAEIEPIADLALVGTHIGLTTELAVNPPLFSRRDDEVHQLAELFVSELQALVGGGATNRVDGE